MRCDVERVNPANWADILRRLDVRMKIVFAQHSLSNLILLSLVMAVGGLLFLAETMADSTRLMVLALWGL